VDSFWSSRANATPITIVTPALTTQKAMERAVTVQKYGSVRTSR
jgi:hypothetical protein